MRPRQTAASAENDSSDPRTTGVGVRWRTGHLGSPLLKAKFHRSDRHPRVLRHDRRGRRWPITPGAEVMVTMTWQCSPGSPLAWSPSCSGLGLIWRMVQAHYSHFLSPDQSATVRLDRGHLQPATRHDGVAPGQGCLHPRQQSLMDRWLGLGTVVVVPTEKSNYQPSIIAGVDDPKGSHGPRSGTMPEPNATSGA